MSDLKDHVYGQWIRDIRAWLETQPGPTEGDASPLDGILRVMEHKDEQLAECRRLLREFSKPARRWSQTEWLVVIADKDFEAARAAGGV